VPDSDLGANKFTFGGDRTHIVYFPETPSPGPIQPRQEGGKLEYQGIEGELTFFGKDIDVQPSSLGTLLTVTLQPDLDAGGVTLTVVLPLVFKVSRQNPLTFQALGVKATSRGRRIGPGVQFTYTILPLLGTAEIVTLPH
jgi:hypothetical protein